MPILKTGPVDYSLLIPDPLHEIAGSDVVSLSDEEEIMVEKLEQLKIEEQKLAIQDLKDLAAEKTKNVEHLSERLLSRKRTDTPVTTQSKIGAKN